MKKLAILQLKIWIYVMLLTIVSHTSGLTCFADDKQAKRAVSNIKDEDLTGERQRYEEQLEMVKGSIDQWKEGGERHPYYGGVPIYEVILNNIKDIYDIRVPDEQYQECLDWEQIGFCLTPIEGYLVPTPFVSYYGPWQKGEEVAEPFSTAYVNTDTVTQAKQAVEKDYETKILPAIVKSNLKFAEDVTLRYTNSKDSENREPKFSNYTPDKKIIAAGQKAAQQTDARFREVSQIEHGWVQGDFHLFPADSAEYDLMKEPSESRQTAVQIQLSVIQELTGASPPSPHWCHNTKFPSPWLSEFPDNYLNTRTPEMSNIHFGREMSQAFSQNDPFTCIRYNALTGYTPDKVLSAVGGGGSPFAPCLSVNNGMLVPVTHKFGTQYQTVAAALGMVRSRAAHRIASGIYYDIDPLRDKFQWHQSRLSGPVKEDERTYMNESPYTNPFDQGDFDRPIELVNPKQIADMDRATKKLEEGQRPCRPIQRWVLDYERANMKKPPEDHWNMINHWRKIQCCLFPGSFVFINFEIPGDLLEIKE